LLPTPQINIDTNNSNLLIFSTSDLKVSHDKTEGLNGLSIALLKAPFTVWTMNSTDENNLNGTHLQGPSFGRGLDCYSNKDDCVREYYQVMGRDLLSRDGWAVVDDLSTPRFADDNNDDNDAFVWFDGDHESHA